MAVVEPHPVEGDVAAGGDHPRRPGKVSQTDGAGGGLHLDLARPTDELDPAGGGASEELLEGTEDLEGGVARGGPDVD